MLSHDQKLLLRRLALAGPGWRGARVPWKSDEREAHRAEFSENEGPFEPLWDGQDRNWIQRSAKLFEAGEFPDKNLVVRPDDLLVLEANFDQPVPVLIEHGTHPLELGYLTDVRAAGGELFGTIALTAEADALIRKSGAESLSLGLSMDLSRIEEVSLVQRPRIESARLFHGSLVDPLSDQKVAAWLDQGRLRPSQALAARALMSASSLVAFSGSMRPVREVVAELLDSLPVHHALSERVPARPASKPRLSADEESFYRQHFPDVDLGAIALCRRSLSS